LKLYLQTVFAECYANAREQAADEARSPLEALLLECSYSIAQLLDPAFLPE
jgi:hypothetical protein